MVHILSLLLIPLAVTAMPLSDPVRRTIEIQGVTAVDPSPLMARTRTGCKAYRKVLSGDVCSLYTQRYGVSDANLHSWNSAIDRGCSNLVINTWVCVDA